MASDDGLGAPEGSEGNSSARLTPEGGSQSLLLSESKDETLLKTVEREKAVSYSSSNPQSHVRMMRFLCTLGCEFLMDVNFSLVRSLVFSCLGTWETFKVGLTSLMPCGTLH